MKKITPATGLLAVASLALVGCTSATPSAAKSTAPSTSAAELPPRTVTVTAPPGTIFVTAPPVTETRTVKETRTMTAAPAASAHAQGGQVTTISSGTYLAGEDMAAGSYKSTGATYWARCKDGGCIDIISNDVQSSATTMRFACEKGEYVTVDGTVTKVG